MTGAPKVGVREAVAVTIIFIIAKLFLSYQVHLFHFAANAAWMVPLIQTVLTIGAFLVLAWLLERHPGKTIVEIGEELVGPVINTFFGIILAVIFVGLVGLILRQFAERALTGFIPDTPISAVVLLFMTGVVPVAYLGFEVIARTARVFIVFLVLSGLTVVVLSSPLWEGHALYPLWGNGPVGLIKGSLVASGVFMEIFLLAVIAPFLPRGSLRRVGFWSIGLSGLFLFLGVISVLLVFSFPASAELAVPFFEVTRTISIGRFGQRLETLFLPMWVLISLIKMSVGLYLVSALMARTLRLPYYRPLILPMAVLVIAVAFIPANVSEAINWDLNVLRRYGYVIVGAIVVTLAGLTWWRERKGDEAHAPRT
ncbi:MAG: GerAB/ArcD/ProY family transporter [Peptococcaceae bacterium]|nr:GerAB/ArcD/ProY family transporter [Peptococcaceae bacterium]